MSMIIYAQDLVNAQVSVNRAVWAMNEQLNQSLKNIKRGSNIYDQYILAEVKQAIKDLTSVMETFK